MSAISGLCRCRWESSSFDRKETLQHALNQSLTFSWQLLLSMLKAALLDDLATILGQRGQHVMVGSGVPTTPTLPGPQTDDPVEEAHISLTTSV